MHEYFAISVHLLLFYTVFNQKPWHLLLLVEKSYAYLITSEK